MSIIDTVCFITTHGTMGVLNRNGTENRRRDEVLDLRATWKCLHLRYLVLKQ